MRGVLGRGRGDRMTEQEAKGLIQGKLNCMKKCDVFNCKVTSECENCEYCYSQGTFGEQKTAFETAIKALGKQIPKRPDIEGDGYADGHLVYDTWICPNCEEHYEIDYDNYDYCPKCGQAIDNSFRDCEVDWSEEE